MHAYFTIKHFARSGPPTHQNIILVWSSPPAYVCSWKNKRSDELHYPWSLVNLHVSWQSVMRPTKNLSCLTSDHSHVFTFVIHAPLKSQTLKQSLWSTAPEMFSLRHYCGVIFTCFGMILLCLVFYSFIFALHMPVCWSCDLLLVHGSFLPNPPGLFAIIKTQSCTCNFIYVVQNKGKIKWKIKL